MGDVIALRIRCRDETYGGKSPPVHPHRHEEAVITAIIAAVLFGIALLLHLVGLSVGPLDSTFFMLAGLLAAALHLAGIGASYRSRVRR
jgi:hypothetical protein